MYVEKTRKRISRQTVVEYILTCDGDAYSIECLEYENSGAVGDRVKIKEITTLYCDAERIFKLIVNNGVTACTLYDVICDLIC